MTPTAFISYSWDSDEHKAWVKTLATRLRQDGVEVTLDQWAAVPGDQLPSFMESSIRDNQFVLVVCTPRYKERSDTRKGGVGYEGDIMTAEVYNQRNQRKFIPIWRLGSWSEVAPSWLSGKYHINLSTDPYSEEQYTDLLSTIHGTRPSAPPLGKPFSTTPKPPIPAQQPQSPTPGPIRIVGVIVDEVTQPRMDGTRGSALYSVPFRLSRTPDSVWERLFVQNWNRPPRWTNMHRPGIASVSGARIVLNGTTLEEVEKYHRDTLKLAIDETNRQHSELEAAQARAEAAKRAQEEAHKQDVAERAKRITFD